MRSVRAFLAATVIAACAGGVAHATPSVWVVPFVALDDQVPSDVAASMDAELTAALAARREVELTQLKKRAASPIDRGVAEGRAALAAGREQYQKFNFGQARAELERAVSLVENAGVPPGEATTLTTALTELAVVLESMNQHAAARETCDALIAIRPDIRFDPIRVPPNLIKMCEAVRSKRSLQTRRVTLTSRPPFAQLYVDGQPVGSSPVSLELPVGAHYLLYVGQNRLTVAQKLTVEAGNEPLSKEIQLPEQPEEKLTDALKLRLRRRGLLPQTVEATTAIGVVVGSDEVVVGGIERAAIDRLRLFVARIETNKSKGPRVIVAEVRDDLRDLKEVMTKVAALVVDPALAPGATFVGARDGSGAQARLQERALRRLGGGAAGARRRRGGDPEEEA